MSLERAYSWAFSPSECQDGYSIRPQVTNPKLLEVSIGQHSLEVATLERNFPNYQNESEKLRSGWEFIGLTSHDLGMRGYANVQGGREEVARWENAYAMSCLAIAYTVTELNFQDPVLSWTLPTWLNGVHLANVMDNTVRAPIINRIRARRYHVPNVVMEIVSEKYTDAFGELTAQFNDLEEGA